MNPIENRRPLMIVIAVVVIAAIIVILGHGRVFNALHRTTVAQGGTEFAHNAQTSSLYLGLNNDLLICTQTQIQLYSSSGSLRFRDSVAMSSPALNASGSSAVVYDAGGQDLRVIRSGKLVGTLTLPADQSILCAAINQKGWTAVTAKQDGYKGVVNVYNADFEPVLTISLSSRYVSDAIVTPDCKGVYLISPGEAGGAFSNTLLYYTLSSREYPARELSLGSNVVLSLRSDSGRCWILGDKSLMILDSSGRLSAQYDYGGQYLKLGTLQGDGYAAIMLSPSSSGSSGKLITIDKNGEPYNELELSGQMLSIAAQEDYIALLSASDIFTTTHKLNSYKIGANQQGSRSIVVYADGSCGLASSALIRGYVPNGRSVDNDSKEQEETPEETNAVETAETAETTETVISEQSAETAPEEAAQ